MTGYLKGHSQLYYCADLDTSFPTLKKVPLNLKSKLRVEYLSKSASILAVFWSIFNRLLKHMSIKFDYPSQSRAPFAGERSFQNPRVCLQAVPSFPSPTPLFRFLALAPFFARETPKIPFLDLSLLPNPTETLATQARRRRTEEIACVGQNNERN